MPSQLGPGGKAERALLEQHGLWDYCDDTRDLNPPCFPQNLRHLEERFSSPAASPSTAPVPGGTQLQTCQECCFQTTPASPAAPEPPLTAPVCQKEEGFPTPRRYLAGGEHLPLLPTQTEPAPSRVEGYSQLRANFGGPDAVEGVLQLHSPAKRRENTKLPTGSESPTSALQPGKSQPRCFPAWVRRRRGGKRFFTVLWDKIRCWEIPSVLQRTHRSLCSLHETGLCIQPRGLNCWSLLREVAGSLCSGKARPGSSTHGLESSAAPTSHTCRR